MPESSRLAVYIDIVIVPFSSSWRFNSIRSELEPGVHIKVPLDRIYSSRTFFFNEDIMIFISGYGSIIGKERPA
jgi:hypothetical protein